MRILIVAEHASTQFGGEAFLPLHYFRVLRARNIECWLLVHGRTRSELEALFPQDRERMYFIEDTWFHFAICRAGRFLPSRIGEVTLGLLTHLYTEWLQKQLARQLIPQHQIDVVHVPIPVSPRSPSVMFGLGVPVVFGPMNGGMEFPPGFHSRQSKLVSQFVAIGRAFSDFVNWLLPGKLRAKTLLVANRRTYHALPRGIRGEVLELVENGVDLSRWSTTNIVDQPIDRSDALSKELAQEKPTYFIFVGRLVDWKAVDLLLTAFQRVCQQCWAKLEIIGDGPMRLALERQCRELDLSTEVSFAGWLSQEQCAQRLAQADVMVLPSLFECGGAVVLEAMAMGLPVIATRWGGPADYLDETCGILVDPTSETEFVQNFALAMVKLGQSVELRQQLGRVGQQRIYQEFDWERKVDRLLDIYSKTIQTS